MIETIVLAVVAAMAFSITGLLKSQSYETLKASKLLATVCTGAIVGVIFAFSGLPITEVSVIAQMGTYGWITAMIENLIKWALRSQRREE